MKTFEEAIALVEAEVNKAIQKHIKDEMIKRLNQLTDNQRLLFKKMYSHTDLSRSIEDIVNKIETKLDYKELRIIYRQIYNSNILDNGCEDKN